MISSFFKGHDVDATFAELRQKNNTQEGAEGRVVVASAEVLRSVSVGLLARVAGGDTDLVISTKILSIHLPIYIRERAGNQ